MQPENDYISNDRNDQDCEMATEDLLEYAKQQLLLCANGNSNLQDVIRRNFPINPLCDEIYSELRELYINDIEIISMIQEIYSRLDNRLSDGTALANNMQESETNENESVSNAEFTKGTDKVVANIDPHHDVSAMNLEMDSNRGKSSAKQTKDSIDEFLEEMCASPQSQDKSENMKNMLPNVDAEQRNRNSDDKEMMFEEQGNKDDDVFERIEKNGEDVVECDGLDAEIISSQKENGNPLEMLEGNTPMDTDVDTGLVAVGNDISDISLPTPTISDSSKDKGLMDVSVCDEREEQLEDEVHTANLHRSTAFAEDIRAFCLDIVLDCVAEVVYTNLNQDMEWAEATEKTPKTGMMKDCEENNATEDRNTEDKRNTYVFNFSPNGKNIIPHKMAVKDHPDFTFERGKGEVMTQTDISLSQVGDCDVHWFAVLARPKRANIIPVKNSLKRLNKKAKKRGRKKMIDRSYHASVKGIQKGGEYFYIRQN